MPSLADHQSNDYVKLLIEGDSKCGKTGSLASLVCAGYKLRVMDWDNGLDTLKQFVARDCPSMLGNVEFVTLRDKRKATAEGSVIDGGPKAFITGIKLLDRWKYGDTDLGAPAEWGPDCILVIDSLTFMSDAAFDWRETLTPRGKSGQYDARATYGDAQDAIEKMLAMLTGEYFRTNVIVISHVKYVERPDGTTKGYPVSVGSALSPVIPRYFNNVIRYNMKGDKRTVETVSSPMFDLANAAPFKMGERYPIETALADFFGVLREPPLKKQATAPVLKRKF